MDTINWQSVRHQFIYKFGRLNPRITLTRPRLAIMLLGLVALWGLMWLGITTQTVFVGQHLRDLDAQLDQTQRQNAQLEYDIAVLTQPDRIIKRATALGMRPASPSQTVYLDIKYPLRAAYVPEKKSVEPPTSDWTTWLNDAFAALGLSSPARLAEASQ
jgi:cell division protein FtsL